MKNKLFLNEEETNAIIDVMICFLEMMDEDHVEKVLYGKNVYDEDYELPSNHRETIDRLKHINEVMENNKKAFMNLFSSFFWELWD